MFAKFPADSIYNFCRIYGVELSDEEEKEISFLLHDNGKTSISFPLTNLTTMDNAVEELNLSHENICEYCFTWNEDTGEIRCYDSDGINVKLTVILDYKEIKPMPKLSEKLQKTLSN